MSEDEMHEGYLSLCNISTTRRDRNTEIRDGGNAAEDALVVSVCCDCRLDEEINETDTNLIPNKQPPPYL